VAEVKGIASVAVAKVDPYSMQNSACIGTFGPSSTDFLPPSFAARPPSSPPSPPSSPPSPPVASFLLPPGPITFHPNVTMQS